MKDRKKSRLLVPWNIFFWFILVLVSVSGFTFSTFRLFFTEKFHPRLVSWRNPEIRSTSGETPAISVRETVTLPDQALIFLKYPPSTPLLTKDDIDCSYFLSNSSEPQQKLPPLSVDDGEHLDCQIVRCPLHRRGFTISVAVKSNGNLPVGPTLRWDSLAYEAIIDRDNTTIVFVKGLNLRSGRTSDASRFECVYGWDFTKPQSLVRSEVLSVAQEIVRCKTPLSVLSDTQGSNHSMKVSVRVKLKGILPTVARPGHRMEPGPPTRKQHQICVCTMLRNQAKFFREWVMYHTRIGVQRWFIYDNNSDDGINDLIGSLVDANFNITRHVWPWIKSQEAGFAHCALRARDSCEWVGFIDVDEFLHLTSGLSLNWVVGNQSRHNKVGELRVKCHNFGPSGRKRVPIKGVMVGYTCRMAAPERHKSLVRPEALDSTLINLVHHFHLKGSFKYANVNRNVMVINHYKYQVWEVFKEKFYRRVATYVSDWQEKENARSKDRAPGLGTRAIEPPNWSTRFCQVMDTRLKDRVLEMFSDPKTRMLPWQEQQDEQEDTILVEKRKKKRRKRAARVLR